MKKTEGIDEIENNETVEKTEVVYAANTTYISDNTEVIDVDKAVEDPTVVALSIQPNAALIPSQAAREASAMPPPPSLSLALQFSSLVGLVHRHPP